MAKELAIVLHNGSLNSAVVAALAQQRHRLVLLFCETTPNPGRPAQAFDQQVQHFKPYRSHHCPMHFLGSLEKDGSRSSTAADPRVAEAAPHQLLNLMPLIAVGLRYAAYYNAPLLHLGLRVGPESAELARVTEHGQIWTEMMQLTCERPGLEVQMPLLDLEPWQVVDLGVQVNAPLQFTWTCDTVVGEPCGVCRGCRAREGAFTRAGKPDPARNREPAKV